MTHGLLQREVATSRGALLGNREGMSRDQGRDCSLPSVPLGSPIYDTDRLVWLDQLDQLKDKNSRLTQACHCSRTDLKYPIEQGLPTTMPMPSHKLRQILEKEGGM